MPRLRNLLVPFLGALVLTLPAIAQAPAASAAVNDVTHPGLVSEQAAPWTPKATKGKVNALVQIGNTMYAGGTFTQAQEPGGPVIQQPYLFSFNATTGAINTGFRPVLDKPVEALEAGPDGNLIVGGRFKTVNGETWKRLVKLDPTTGQRITAFQTQIKSGSIVYDLVLRNGTLYAAGAFSKLKSATGTQARSELAALDPITGAVSPNLNLPFDGQHNNGKKRINNIDVTPDGSTLVAIGNFTTVAGQPREQIAMIDLSTTPATLSSWQTTRFVMQCHPKFDTYTTALDIDPTGTYFVVGTDGAYSGGPNNNTLCDAVSRWELGRTGPNQQPTWAAYAGGDSRFAVAATGSVIYAGGHQRWENNPWRGDAVGPGAVVRTGIAALDPVNGVPLSWNPIRNPRGTGVQVFYPTAAGLWFGDDTCCLNGQNRDRIKFLPLDGGWAVPQPQQPALPNTLYQLPLSSCPSLDPSVLFRVNAGGPQLATQDCGPDWSADTSSSSPYRTSGSNTATWDQIPATTPNVPATTPIDVYSSERWDPAGGDEMQWNFPVDAGTAIQVRLYLADSYTGTSQPGQRVFDVTLDGTLVLNHEDLTNDVGWHVGTMKSFDIASDGNVNIDFGHVTENPPVDAIEIVRTDITPVTPDPNSTINARSFDGTTPGALTQISTPSADWAQARGGFLANGNIYTGWADGHFYARTFDGTNLGPARDIALNGLVSGSPTYFPIASITGMALDHGYLYYTVSGDSNLYLRGFSTESEIVGAQRFQASSNGGVDWSQVRGFTIAGGKIFFARSDGNLYALDFTGGVPAGTETLVSGPGVDGIDWRSAGLFIPMPNA